MTYPNTAEGNRAWVRDKIKAAGLTLDVEAEALTRIEEQ